VAVITGQNITTQALCRVLQEGATPTVPAEIRWISALTHRLPRHSRRICVATAAGPPPSVRAQIRLIWIHVLVPGRVALAGAALPGTQAMAGDVTTAGHGAEGAGRGLPGAAVRARIPSVARSALWGITGKMAASFQSCPAAGQS
jgi:hypothetical protein